MNTKSYVLELLEKNRGESISGEELARALHVSRTAVWKAVNELKKEGYRITAATNKGYSLSWDANILSPEGMLPYLDKPEYARRIHIFKTLESTNQMAKRMALEGAEHGTAVLADEQTAGRGRLGRGFFSPPASGVYISFVLRPRALSSTSAALVTTAASVAVCRAISNVCAKEPEIKWVNDIYLDGKKICGILTEAITDFESGNIDWIILGIGVNFNTEPSAFPPELRRTAGAVYGAGESGATRNSLAAGIVNQVMRIDGWLEKRSFLAEYKRRSMVLGKRIRILRPNGTSGGVALDIDGEGHLIVRKDDGETEILRAGEVSIHPSDG